MFSLTNVFKSPHPNIEGIEANVMDQAVTVNVCLVKNVVMALQQLETRSKSYLYITLYKQLCMAIRVF